MAPLHSDGPAYGDDAKKTQKISQHHSRTVGQRGGRRSTGGPRGGVSNGGHVSASIYGFDSVTAGPGRFALDRGLHNI